MSLSMNVVLKSEQILENGKYVEIEFIFLILIQKKVWFLDIRAQS